MQNQLLRLLQAQISLCTPFPPAFCPGGPTARCVQKLICRRLLLLAGVLCAVLAQPAAGAERTFDFSDAPEGGVPPGFRSALTGQGKPGQWKVVLDDVAPLLPPLNPQAPHVTKQAGTGPTLPGSHG